MNNITWTSVATSWGPCGLLWKKDADGSAKIIRVWAADVDAATLRAGIEKQFPTATRSKSGAADNPSWLLTITNFLQRYYDANDPAIPRLQSAALKRILDWSCCEEFQRTVLMATAKIPFGATISYGQLAQQIGRENAARAVGGALAKNPWPVLVPCHRVIGADGKMTGFSAPGAKAAKARMIQMERQRVNALEPPSEPSDLFAQPLFA
ncbi:MAG TPA: methylated-DNA--[protein]-cysteine S-methyltransferase [Phycisphaerae bacterium]|nr:methylated-DNA--[protein]-cysteine S-methyltransferase [Phycisphaerae bacterium]